MSETHREYLKRIVQVLDYIEQNLGEELSLDRLAALAHYSPYHFHRVFQIVVGERPLAYVNRKRIERIASILLVNPEIPLKEVLFRYGFNSDNSFSRAFKKHYGVSPTTFKTEGREILRKIGIESFSSAKYLETIDQPTQWMKMNAHLTIENLSARSLASMSTIGDVSKMGDMFRNLMSWGHDKDVLDMANFKAITLYHDNPSVTQISRQRISACVTTNQEIDPDGEIQPLTFQAGLYVVGRLEIPGTEIGMAWNSICTWIMEQGLEFRDGQYVEVYHNDHTTHPEQKFILDICIPIEKADRFAVGEPIHVPLAKSPSGTILSYHQLIHFMKELRGYFQRSYDPRYKLGKVYQGHPDFSYFSLSPEELKPLKLKYVIVLDHQNLTFSICLSGQNKAIRKKWWHLFKGSNFNTYQLVDSIEESLFILDTPLIQKPDFNQKTLLVEQIESGAIAFMDEMTEILATGGK